MAHFKVKWKQWSVIKQFLSEIETGYVYQPTAMVEIETPLGKLEESTSRAIQILNKLFYI